MYLDLQLAMLVSTDCSVAMASSCVERGLYHVVSRSISLAWRDSVTQREKEAKRKRREHEEWLMMSRHPERRRNRKMTHQQGQQQSPALHVVFVKLRPSVTLLGRAWMKRYRKLKPLYYLHSILNKRYINFFKMKTDLRLIIEYVLQPDFMQ